MRNGGWKPLIQKVTLFGEKYDCELIVMNGAYFDGISRRIGSKVNNLHHYHVDVLYSAIDMQLQELDHCFNEADTRLLLYNEFANLKDIKDLCKKMVETKKNEIYPTVYLLIKLVLILPVATSTMERVFLAMNLIKSDLRSILGDDFMRDCLVSCVEKRFIGRILEIITQWKIGGLAKSRERKLERKSFLVRESEDVEALENVIEDEPHFFTKIVDNDLRGRGGYIAGRGGGVLAKRSMVSNEGSGGGGLAVRGGKSLSE
ncbi:zinc finger MYM-type protein 1-like protein [Tanacetum coccineum]|uniref:Zinc finger MYM-type protein 1-like protein n=1 Tax=Tanacetum coccineum TaxID=301880 RepID=A0ABQ5H8F4_9ASTR